MDSKMLHLADGPKRGVQGRVKVYLLRERKSGTIEVTDRPVSNTHNVFTDAGRNWLTSLMSYMAFTQSPGVNEPASSKRRYDGVRYMMVGTGEQEETNAVESLVNPVPYNLAGDYLAQVVAPNELPGIGISAVFERVWGLNEISMPSTVYVSEAGLFVGGPEDAPLDPSVSNYAPIAYTTFEPVPVSTAFMLGIRWEIKV